MPYWQLWLEDHGCSKGQIGAISTAMIAVRIATLPFVLQAAERRRRRRTALVLCAFASALFMLPMPIATAFAALLALHVALSIVHSAQIPLIDGMTIRAAILDPSLRYAKIRVWGSVAFLVATLGAGELLHARGIAVVWWTIVAGFVATALAGLALRGADHDTSGDVAGGRAATSIRSLLALPGFVAMLVANGLIQGSHATYYSFSSVHWRASGLSEREIGLLWAEGVFAEILLFWFGRRFAERLGARRLFLLGATSSVVRWGVLGATTGFGTLAIFNALHAFSFGATHLATMGWIQANVPRVAAATAQGMLSAWSAGLGFVIATSLATWLYPSFGAGPAFTAMIALAALGAGASLRLRR